MVLRWKAKKDSVSECKGSEILPHETPEKSVINNTIIIPTPRVDLTSGVPTETGSAAVNAVVPKPVTCVVPKTVTCVPQRKQIFVSRLNPDLSSLDIAAYIRKKVQVDDLKVERFNFPYAREVSYFKIGVPCAHFATMFSANFWLVGIFVKEYEAKKKKIRSKEVGNPLKSHPHLHPHLYRKTRLFSSAFLSEYKRFRK